MVKIPTRLDEILPAAAMEKLLDVLQQPDISGKVREAMQRVGLQDTSPLDRVRDAWHQARGWLDSVSDRFSSHSENQLVLNATGRLISSGLAGVPWAPAIAHAFASAAVHYQAVATVEQNAGGIIDKVLSGHSAAWFRSVSEAMRVLGSSELSRDGVVLSRADAVRIAGVGDVRAMLAASSNPLIDIGAANGVSADEWQDSLKGTQQILVLTSPNNLSQGESASHRSQAIAAARASGTPIIELLCDGVLCQKLSAQIGLPHIRECLATGVDVVVVPLNLLLAGPGVLVVGNAKIVSLASRAAEQIGANMTGASLLAAALAIELAGSTEENGLAAETGPAAHLLVNPENLKNRSQRLAVQLSGVGQVAEAQEVEMTSTLGPTPWNRYQLSSFGVRLRPASTLEDLIKQIERGEARQGIKLEFVRQTDALLLNLRFVLPEQDHQLVQVIAGQVELAGEAEERSATSAKN